MKRALGLCCALAALVLAGCPRKKQPAPTDPRPKCSDRSQCDAGMICDTSGHCAKCSYSRDCLPREVCSPVTKLCQLKPGWGNDCTLNKECPLGQFCVQGLCKPGDQVTPCLADKDCAVGQKCNVANSVCEEDLGCFSDPECPPGEYCDTAAHVCKRSCTAATESQLCAVSEHCVNGRCVECTTDADCKPGLTCDTGNGKCSGESVCYSNRDCPVPLVCNPATSQCSTQPPPCLQDADCPPGQRCAVTNGECVPAACQPDAFDPNNDQPSAYVLSGPGTYGPATLCGTEHDWYALPLHAADRLEALVETDPLASQQFRTRLVDPGGHTLATGDVVIDRVVTADATYYLDLATTDPQASYSLGIYVSHGDPCQDDVYDQPPAWNGDYLDATPLAPGTYYNLVLCAGDEDWYAFALPSGQSFDARMTSDPLQGDLDLYLYDSDGRTELARSATGNAIEEVQTATSSGGRVYLRVVGAQPASQNYYDLQVTVQ